ncbi:MAG: multiprotein-bridging factor 1 family protein [Elainella sp.]
MQPIPPDWDYLTLEQPAIGQFVRELRQMLSLTQEKFAAQLGVTFPTINRWENGHAVPSPLALRQISQLLNQLDKSPDPTLRQRSQTLRTRYFNNSPTPRTGP